MHDKICEVLNQKVQGCSAVVQRTEVGDASVVVAASQIVEVCRTLKEYPEFDFHVLQVITGTDRGEHIEVSYILASYHKNLELIVKTTLPKGGEHGVPEIDSVVSLWSSANFQERECYDMVGVKFKNHPDLRRILCPDDWEGFPLRKDYKAAKEYRGMVIYPEHKLNIADREFAEKQKQARKQ